MRLLLSFFLIILSCICTSAQNKAVGDTLTPKAARELCDCLTKGNIEAAKTEPEMQQVLLKCYTDTLNTAINKTINRPGLTDAEQSEIIKTVMLEMFSAGCPAFAKLAISLSQTDSAVVGDKPSSTKTIVGLVVKIEERDFLYITVKSSSAKLVTFILMQDIDGCEDWIYNPFVKLLNKRVSVKWNEEDVYQPKFKKFKSINELKVLKVL